MKFDELNSLDLYYKPMQIDIGSKERRRELAELLVDAFLFFFSAYEVHQQYNQILQKQLYQQLLADKITEAVTKVTGIDSYMSDHIRTLAKEVVNTTFDKVSANQEEKPDSRKSPEKNKNTTPQVSENSDKANSRRTQTSPVFENESKGASIPSDAPKDETPDDHNGYWLSYDRAENIAKSEANTFLNYTDFVEAKDRGATQKRWLTMLDDKVRQTHNEVEGQTIGIDENFVVGNSLMKFPHDLSESPDPQEVIGCRCAVEYL